jgi:hemoglobin
MLSLYDRLGGDSVVSMAVDVFCQKIFNDPNLEHFFSSINIESHSAKLRIFIQYALGGIANYNSKNIAKAHENVVKDQGLDDSHFDFFIMHLINTFQEIGLHDNDIQEMQKSIEPYRNIIFKRS